MLTQSTIQNICRDIAAADVRGDQRHLVAELLGIIGAAVARMGESDRALTAWHLHDFARRIDPDLQTVSRH